MNATKFMALGSGARVAAQFSRNITSGVIEHQSQPVKGIPGHVTTD